MEREAGEPLPEERLGAALRQARKGKGLGLREMARRLHRVHSSLSEYEKGHRLAPLDVVEAYEAELGLPSRSLRALHDQVRLEVLGEDRSHRRTYVLRPAASAVHQLPADVAEFSGRETELGKLREMALGRRGGSGPAVVVIVGMPGVGKTTLAVHAAQDLKAHFPDIQLYVDLQGYDPRQSLRPAQVLDRFLRALGIEDDALPREAEAQLALYRTLLQDKRALVVLDNASSADQVRVLVPPSPTCVVLVTSRESLGGLVARGGARQLDLGVLTRDEALELLSAKVGSDRVRAELDKAYELVDLCGNLPLAVSIAGARLEIRPGMSIADLRERLRVERRRLEELQVGDEGIRASFTLSWRALDQAAARMFCHLALVPGPDFGLDVAAALDESSPEDAERVLEGLVDAHLLAASGPAGRRYRFHDLLRLYGRERVEEACVDRSAALSRMFRWYLETASAAAKGLAPGRSLLSDDSPGGAPGPPAFADRADALAWFETERPCLVPVALNAAECGFPSIAWQLADAMYSFFDLRKHWTDWFAVHEAGLAAARQVGDGPGEVSMLAGLASGYADLWRYDEALACHETALRICRETGYRRGEGRVLNNLGVVHRMVGCFEAAVECNEQAREIHRELGDRWREAHALHRIGEALCHLRRLDEAVDALQEALVVHREVGDPQGEGWAHHHLGEAYFEWRRFDQAIDSYRNAVEIRDRAGFQYGVGITLEALGMAYEGAQDLDMAEGSWRKALSILSDMGAPEAGKVRTRLEALSKARGNALPEDEP